MYIPINFLLRNKKIENYKRRNPANIYSKIFRCVISINFLPGNKKLKLYEK